MFSQPRALGIRRRLQQRRFVELLVVPRQLRYIRQLQRWSLECWYIRQLQRWSLECWPLLLALIGHEPRLQHPSDCERCYSSEDQIKRQSIGESTRTLT
jgi:hypothetical protein